MNTGKRLVGECDLQCNDAILSLLSDFFSVYIWMNVHYKLVKLNYIYIGLAG